MAHACPARHSAVDGSPPSEAGAHRFGRSSQNRLTVRDLPRFPSESLFDRLGRAACTAGCLPRKELFETWEMARRVRRRLRGGRVVDLAGGHGLLAHVLLLLDDSSPSAQVVDVSRPPSADRVAEAMVQAWPRLAGRVHAAVGSMHQVNLGAHDLVVSCHACGALTDRVLDLAIGAQAAVAVMPCCHEPSGAPGALSGWVDAGLAQDIDRATRLRAAGYEVWTLRIPADITPMNRLLVGRPSPTA